MKSSDFEVYSTANEKTTRETLKHFEQVRSFFSQATGKDASKSATIRIVVFNSKKEYEPYRPNEVAAAYYLPGVERDYIVLGSTSTDAFPIAVHEYVHLVVQRAGLKFPVWLNEGLADLYSTLQEYGGQLAVGGVIAGRYQELFVDKWVPLSTILAVDHNSPFYNEKNKAGGLYSESWAFTHMLALSTQYRPGFPKLMEAINAGTPSEEALVKVYGKPLPVIEKDLQQHIRTEITRAALFPLKLEKGSSDTAGETPPAFDVKLTLVDLVDRPGKEDEVEKRLTELSTLDASRPEPHAELGYLAWRRGHEAEGRKHFEKAFALGSQNPRLLWDYSRMASETPTEAIPVLVRLLAKEPEKVEARILLAALQLGAEHADEALQTLQPVTKISRENAPKLFKILAYAQLQVGKTEEARTSVKKWSDNAQTPADRDESGRLQEYLAGLRPGAKPNVGFTVREAVREAGVPALPVSAGGKPNWQSATGAFVLLDCNGEKATIVMQAASGKQMFLIDDPKKVLIDGGGRTVDMTCGPQPSVAVRVEFEPPGDANPGFDGIVRALHFGAGEAK